MQESAANLSNVQTLQNEKQSLQKELNLSIKRYTAVNIKLEMEAVERRKDHLSFEVEKQDFFKEKAKVMDIFDVAQKNLENDMEKQLENVEERVKLSQAKVGNLLEYVAKVVNSVKESKARDSERKLSLVRAERKTETMLGQLKKLQEEVREKNDLYLGGVEEIKGLKEEIGRLERLLEEKDAREVKDKGEKEEKEEKEKKEREEMIKGLKEENERLAKVIEAKKWEVEGDKQEGGEQQADATEVADREKKVADDKADDNKSEEAYAAAEDAKTDKQQLVAKDPGEGEIAEEKKAEPEQPLALTNNA